MKWNEGERESRARGTKRKSKRKRQRWKAKLVDESPVDGIDEPEVLASVDEEVRVGVGSRGVGCDFAVRSSRRKATSQITNEGRERTRETERT